MSGILSPVFPPTHGKLSGNRTDLINFQLPPTWKNLGNTGSSSLSIQDALIFVHMDNKIWPHIYKSFGEKSEYNIISPSWWRERPSSPSFGACWCQRGGHKRIHCHYYHYWHHSWWISNPKHEAATETSPRYMIRQIDPRSTLGGRGESNPKP